ncbi:flavin reductase family protein [Telluribacter humicola]|uniref:flavin reductase family protein n=1 Tax=Telluribacter humicola TaxID=1720261 RepID=UPI001A967AA6|nr:flavin reductase family protein [Telluribacter humicola]
MKTIDPSELGARAFYKHMTASVAPRPIAFASTVDAQGVVNLSPFSFFNYMGIDPPILVFAPNRRGRDNAHKHTALNIREVPEVVINLVDYAMVEQVSLASAEFERGVNEFTKAGFTAIPSERVSPPRVRESPVQFECKVLEVKEIGSMVLVIAQVVLAHFSEALFSEDGQIDQRRTDWVARMGADYYARATGEALFEVPRPQMGIGVDALPESVRTSRILTGNDLGRLGSVLQLPEPTEVQAYGQSETIRTLYEDAVHGCQYFPDLLHRRAQQLLAEGKIKDAWLTLLQV